MNLTVLFDVIKDILFPGMGAIIAAFAILCIPGVTDDEDCYSKKAEQNKKQTINTKQIKAK